MSKFFQRKTNKNPRGGSKSHADSRADVAISESPNFSQITLRSRTGTKQIDVKFRYSFVI
jgi:hypothetical protein